MTRIFASAAIALLALAAIYTLFLMLEWFWYRGTGLKIVR